MMRLLSVTGLILAGLVLAASLSPAQTADKPGAQAKPPATQGPASTKPAEQKPGPASTKPAEPAKSGQKPAPATKTGVSNQPAPLVVAPAVPPPPGYVIGPDDVLQVLFWREKDFSAEVTVRPDGMISLPLLNDLKAAGLTPEQLREAVTTASRKYFEVDPNVTINIKAINSRKVFITGSVAKPGPYLLLAPTTVLQLISMAGGLTEFAKQKDIAVMRTEGGKQLRFPFNYKDVAKGKNMKQNIELKPGDTVIVP
jgi:polysaccharide biosynthesis/export protein